MSKNLNFGVLIELMEDWLRNNQDQNRILARIFDREVIVDIPVGGAYFVPEDKTIWLVTKSRDQENIFDDDGNLLNDESPKGIYRDLEELEKKGLKYSISIGIEIWFEDGEDDLQYRLACHDYSINQNHLILMHTMGMEEEEHENEFRRMLHEQYP